jgi:light-regulated signal transduction histidine kinase (bacteriophytochrome)
VDASEAIGHAIANLQAAIEESGASITYTGLPRVMVDPVHLQQIFQNLIGNAIKYRSNERPCISVKATRRNKEWLFAVKDNGIGIQEEHADQIFGVFKRLHPSGPHTGTGIGLAICERLVRRYGGSIWVESSPGRGATFFFTMPDSTT